MPLLAKGQRLSVQRVSSEAYEAVYLLGEKGGWEDLLPAPKSKKRKAKAEDVEEGQETEEKKPVKKARGKKATIAKDELVAEEEPQEKETQEDVKPATQGSRRSSRSQA